MSAFGTVEECIIFRDKVTNQAKGAGFVVFASHQEAERAILALHNQVVISPMKNPLQVPASGGRFSQGIALLSGEVR